MTYLKKHSNKLAVALVLFIALGAALKKDGKVFLPQKITGDAMFSVSAFIDAGRDYLEEKSDLRAENRALKTENHVLKLERERLLLLEEENQRLSQLLDVKKRYFHFDTLCAFVNASDPWDLGRSFTADRGRADGVLPGMAVISQGGLAGTVSESNEGFCKIQTILDTSRGISVMCAETGDLGILKGDDRMTGYCYMDYIFSTAKISVGDEIVTSGISGSFPRGLKIGSVEEIFPDGLTQKAKIKPLADLDRMDAVLIIRGFEEDLD